MSEWLLDPDVAYLNHGAFGAVCDPVAAAAEEIRRMIEREPSDLLVRRLPGLLDDVRGQVAELIGADPAGCVFVPNATAGTATVLGSLPLGAGDEVVVTDHGYHSVDVQLERLAARGVAARRARVPLWPRSAGDVVDAVLAEVGANTRLIVVDAIGSPTGFVFPVRDIVAAAHDRGVPVLVDAAHAPGQLALSVDDDGADFWVGNLHKWVCSPRAAAVLVVAPRWRPVIRPLVASHDFDLGYQPAFDWTGSHDPTPVLAVPAALQFWEEQGGWDVVRRQQRDLVATGSAVVGAAITGEIGPAEPFAASMRVVSLATVLTFDEAHEVGRRLFAEHRVEAVVMSFAGRSWVRMCGQVYNRPSDYDRLATALPAVIAG